MILTKKNLDLFAFSKNSSLVNSSLKSSLKALYNNNCFMVDVICPESWSRVRRTAVFFNFSAKCSCNFKRPNTFFSRIQPTLHCLLALF